MIETFLTAFDPSDLPGASVDPLGFETGYLFLADKILPGLTNVASRPRYFGLLCAGVHLCGDHPDLNERDAIRLRHETILRLERFWALANVLADSDKAGGVRGVTYAREYVETLRIRGDTRTTAKYPLLSRQSQYGAIGMYANVADGMQFLNREDLILTPARGQIAAEAFCEETELPSSLRRAVVDDSDVSLSTLEAWGRRAHVEAEVKRREAECLNEALHASDVRSRMADVLHRHRAKVNTDTELDRLGRIVRTLRKEGRHDDLKEAGECIIAFEDCYRHALLALERMLWLCRNHAAASITLSELAGDSVIKLVKTSLPGCARRLTGALDQGVTPAFKENLARLSDVRRFIELASGMAGDNQAFIDAIIARHTEVQHGKFDRSRRKMPWLERNGSRIRLTMTRAGGLNGEAMQPAHIAPHPYRLGAADALIAASLKGAKA